MLNIAVPKPVHFFLLALLVFASPTQAQSSQDAKKMIENLSGQVLKTLANKKTTRQAREATFRKLFTENFHVRSIGVFVLGRHWRTATQAQRVAYIKVFEDFVVKTYTVRMSSFAGETFQVVRSNGPDKRGVYIVDSEIVRPGKPPIVLSWIIRRSKKGLRVVDIVIENISMAQAQRQDFASIIKQKGSVDGLIASLKAKVKQLDQTPS